MFSADEAATKLLWLALRNITAKWERTAAGDESVRDTLRRSVHADSVMTRLTRNS
jgi:hypothetical protein